MMNLTVCASFPALFIIVQLQPSPNPVATLLGEGGQYANRQQYANFLINLTSIITMPLADYYEEEKVQ